MWDVRLTSVHTVTLQAMVEARALKARAPCLCSRLMPATHTRGVASLKQEGFWSGNSWAVKEADAALAPLLQ